MKDRLALGFLALFLLGMSGCGPSSPAESALAEITVNQEQVAALLEKVSDEASLKAALPEIEKAADRQVAIRERTANLKLSQPEIKSIEAKYAKQGKEVSDRVNRAWKAVQTKAPEGAKQLEPWMIKLGYGNNEFQPIPKP